MDQLNQELTAISTEQARLDATLRQPANASILERSLLLNTLVERKSVSWTRIFADLEAVMPPNVRLIQVRLAADRFRAMKFCSTWWWARRAPSPSSRF